MTEQLGGWLIVGACAAVAGVIWTRKPRATFEAPCYHCGDDGPSRTFHVGPSRIACETCQMEPRLADTPQPYAAMVTW